MTAVLHRPGTLLWAEGGPEEADLHVLGLPFDATASYHAGARFGPHAVREASDALELYSPTLGRSVDTRRVHDLGDVPARYGRPDVFLAEAEEAVAAILAAGKTPLLLGGEHGVTLAALRAQAARHPGLAVLQFDAHADLRPEYLGEPYSHAAVMYHAGELLGEESVFQLGVRSGEEAEFRRARHLRPDLAVGEFLPLLRGRPVYVTVDIDVLDPSVAPGTGTPEPGGVGFRELLAALTEALSALRVVGLDVVEVAPTRDPSGITALAAAKLLRECTILLEAEGRR